MMTAKLIANGGSQAVRLPKSCRFEGTEVFVNRIGESVILMPKNGDRLASMMAATELFTDDFMEDAHDLPIQERSAAL